MVPVPTGRAGRPRCRPAKLHADKGYDYRRCRCASVQRGIQHRSAWRDRGEDRLGRHRWKVERTFAWLVRFRRLTTRYERLVPVYEAFPHLACALVCWNYVLRLLNGQYATHRRDSASQFERD